MTMTLRSRSVRIAPERCRGHMNCMRQVTVDMVSDAVEGLL